MDLKDVLRELPEGPHLELLQVGKTVNWRIVRSEGADLLIGADAKGLVVFVGVLGAEVARTQAGVGVGVTRAELAQALGEADDTAPAVRDRRIVEYGSLPNVRFVTDRPSDEEKARVVAVLVERVDAAAAPPARTCATGGPMAAARAETLQTARAKEPTSAFVRYGCISAASQEAIVVSGDEIVLVAGEPGKLKRLASVPAAGAETVGALDLDGDGKEEIVWAAQRRTDTDLSLDVHVIRWENGRLVESLAQRPFTIGVDAAAAAGVTPAQIDLAVEMRSDRGALVVEGVYLTRVGGRIRELAPVAPAILRLESKRPVAPPPANGDTP